MDSNIFPNDKFIFPNELCTTTVVHNKFILPNELLNYIIKDDDEYIDNYKIIQNLNKKHYNLLRDTKNIDYYVNYYTIKHQIKQQHGVSIQIFTFLLEYDFNDIIFNTEKCVIKKIGNSFNSSYTIYLSQSSKCNDIHRQMLKLDCAGSMYNSFSKRQQDIFKNVVIHRETRKCRGGGPAIFTTDNDGINLFGYFLYGNPHRIAKCKCDVEECGGVALQFMNFSRYWINGTEYFNYATLNLTSGMYNRCYMYHSQSIRYGEKGPSTIHGSGRKDYTRIERFPSKKEKRLNNYKIIFPNNVKLHLKYSYLHRNLCKSCKELLIKSKCYPYIPITKTINDIVNNKYYKDAVKKCQCKPAIEYSRW